MEGFKEKYFGKEIVLSKDQCYVLSTTSHFRQKAADAAQQYLQKYKSYKNFQVFATKGIQDGYDVLKGYFNRTLDILIEMGYYDVNKASAMSFYGGAVFEPWTRMEDFVRESLDESDQRISQSEDYRALRKASRGRVIGGGFGLKGAVGGMAMAGTFNALSGLAHSGVNAIGNAKTRKTERDRLNRVYQSTMMTDCIQYLFADAFLQMAWVFLSYQGNYMETSLPGTEEDLSRAEALRENFSKIPADKRGETAAQILTLAPAEAATYQFLLSQYQDPNGVLGRLAKAVGMERIYCSLVDQTLAPKVDREIKGLSARMQRVTVRETHTAAVNRVLEEGRQNLQEICAQFSLNQGAGSNLMAVYNQRLEQAFSKELEKVKTLEQSFLTVMRKLHATDQQRRTFRSATYETVTQAEEAKRLWAKAAVLNTGCNEKTSLEFKKSLEALEMLMKQSPEALQPDLQSLWETIEEHQKAKDQEERTYLNTLFPSHEARAAAEKQYNDMMAQLLPAGKNITDSDIQIARKTMNAQQDVVEPVRQAVLEQIALQERELNQDILRKKAEQSSRHVEGTLVAINLLYSGIVLWALFFWKLFRIDGADVNVLQLLQMFYHNSDTITAARGFIAIGVIVIAFQMLSNIKQTLNQDFSDVLDYPGTVLVLGLLVWGLTAFLHLTYDIAQAYIYLLFISVLFWGINSVKKKKLDQLTRQKYS